MVVGISIVEAKLQYLSGQKLKSQIMVLEVPAFQAYITGSLCGTEIVPVAHDKIFTYGLPVLNTKIIISLELLQEQVSNFN